MVQDALVGEYLDLLKKALTASIYDQSRWMPVKRTRSKLKSWMIAFLGKRGFAVLNRSGYTSKDVFDGRIWTDLGFTMVGMHRLDNVQTCVEDVLRRNVPGDLVETGVWKGGVTIFMRALLKVHGDEERLIWAADSFDGLPVPKDKDDGADLSDVAELKISLERVQDHFRRFNLLDDRVRFLKGWFADTLPTAPIKAISVLRLDGDLYSSTMDALQSLYAKVSPGGYVIVDDYYSWESCKRAVHDFLDARGEKVDIRAVDWTGAYWQVPVR